MPLLQGWHAIRRNKWKAVQILRGKNTTNTALRLKVFFSSSSGFTSQNIYLAFNNFFSIFNSWCRAAGNCSSLLKCDSSHASVRQCGGDSSFRSSLWHQIQDCRQPMVTHISSGSSSLKTNKTFYLHYFVYFPYLWHIFSFFHANVANKSTFYRAEQE